MYVALVTVAASEPTTPLTVAVGVTVPPAVMLRFPAVTVKIGAVIVNVPATYAYVVEYLF